MPNEEELLVRVRAGLEGAISPSAARRARALERAQAAKAECHQRYWLKFGSLAAALSLAAIGFLVNSNDSRPDSLLQVLTLLNAEEVSLGANSEEALLAWQDAPYSELVQTQESR